MTQPAADPAILKISGLQTHFFTREGTIKAVDGVDLAVGRGEILGLVGESGCGKSVSALSILRLVPSPPGKIVGGRIEFMGQNLLELDSRQMRKVRGAQISMIFQDPLTALNPVLTVGFQIAEVFRFHRGMDRVKRFLAAIKMLRSTEIPSAEERVKHYPHEMSGGIRQRVMIAMGLACEPRLLIADEPTTALDVTVQAQVLKLIKKLCRERQTAVILITHDMGVIANMCQRVAVMYAGRVVEQADVFTLFRAPAHPYTHGLLRCLPKVDQKQERLYSIEGQPPQLNRLPAGCAFAPRCGRTAAPCRRDVPELTAVAAGHQVRCHFPIPGSADDRLPTPC
jgi:oligopeptide/dipeptide ABC transporter ATP-binding protein